VRALLATAVAALVVGSGAAAGSVPPFPSLPGAWSHAEINVTIAGEPHTLTLDRGRIAQVSATQVTIREAGGVFVVVPLKASTLVVVDGRPSRIFGLRRRMDVKTMRIDGGPAVRVRAVSPRF
jgi:hypothetical protein